MAAQKFFRKSQLIAFNNVAAGHDGVLSDPSGELVVKPCKQSEIDFYESASSHQDLAAHIPTFFGKISLGSNTGALQAAGALVLPGDTTPDPPVVLGLPGTVVVENAWAPSNGARIETDMAIVLENVAAGYKKPNILDVKLGARLWADDAPVAKRAKLDNVAAETTSKPLGLRIAGMRIYQGLPDDKEGGITSDGYRFHDRCYGRGFTVETISHGFEDYFLLGREVKAKSPIRKVIKRFVDDLKGLESAIENEESRMYSASLLFVYEGDQQALHDAFTAERDIIASLDRSSTSNGAHADGDNMANGNSVHGETEADDYLGSDEGEGKEIKFPAIQSLKLIDFAHAEWTPGQGSDENILHGIRNVIKILGGLAA